jgi:hypothetical protein
MNTTPYLTSNMNIEKLNLTLGKLHTDLSRRLMDDEDKITAVEFEILENAEEFFDAIRTELCQMEDRHTDDPDESEFRRKPFPGKYAEALIRAFPPGVIAQHLDSLSPKFRARLEWRLGNLPTNK